MIDLDSGDLPRGTNHRRAYNGEVHVVQILSVSPPKRRGARRRDWEVARRRRWWRYMYRGERFKTLSAIAFIVTGDRWMSGNRFFGLRGRKRGC